MIDEASIPSSKQPNQTEGVSKFIQAWTPERRARIESIQSQINDKPSGKNILAYVIIPVAAGEEDEVLQTTFMQYVKQDIPTDQWGLLFFVNSVGEVNLKKVSRTVDILGKLARNNPTVPAHTAGYTYQIKKPISQIRADAWDCALLDIEKKGVAPVIGISNDADCVELSSNYIRKMVDTACKFTEKDMFNCALTYGVVGDPESTINRILKYWEYTAKAQRIQLGKIGMADGNTAIRISSYVGVQGFNAQNEMGEMAELRCNIARQRHNIPCSLDVANDQAYHDVIKFIPDIDLSTDSRRVYAALAQGYPPEFAWTHIPFGTDSDPTRTANTVSLADTYLNDTTQVYILDEIDKSHFKDIDPEVARGIIVAERKKLHLPLPATNLNKI